MSDDLPHDACNLVSVIGGAHQLDAHLQSLENRPLPPAIAPEGGGDMLPFLSASYEDWEEDIEAAYKKLIDSAVTHLNHYTDRFDLAGIDETISHGLWIVDQCDLFRDKGRKVMASMYGQCLDHYKKCVAYVYERQAVQRLESDNEDFQKKRFEIATRGSATGAPLMAMSDAEILNDWQEALNTRRLLNGDEIQRNPNFYRYLWLDYHHLEHLTAPLIGIWPSEVDKACPTLLVDNGDAHLTTIMGSRQGKSVCHVIPNVLAYQGSCVVLDSKGDIYAKTADILKKRGRRVLRFSPFEENSEHTFNPLDYINGANNNQERARALVEAMLTRERSSGDSQYWENQSQNMILGMLLYVAESPEDDTRNMQGLLNFAASPDGLSDAAKAITDNTFDGSLSNLLMRRYLRMAADWQKGGQILDSEIFNDLSAWLSPTVAANTARSSFNPRDLMDSIDFEGEFTLFIDLPSDRMKQYKGVARCILAAIFEMIKHAPNHPKGYKTLFLLDEFLQYGAIDVFTNALREAASYNVRLWTFIQDFEKLKAVYPEDWSSFLNNATVIHGATGSHEHAMQFKEAFGDHTTEQIYYNEDFREVGTGAYDEHVTGWNHKTLDYDRTYKEQTTQVSVPRQSTHFQTEPVIGGQAMRTLPRAWQMVQPVGCKPILAAKLPYFDPYFTRFHGEDD